MRFVKSTATISWKHEAFIKCKEKFGSSSRLLSIPEDDYLWTQVTDVAKELM